MSTKALELFKVSKTMSSPIGVVDVIHSSKLMMLNKSYHLQP